MGTKQLDKLQRLFRDFVGVRLRDRIVKISRKNSNFWSLLSDDFPARQSLSIHRFDVINFLPLLESIGGNLFQSQLVNQFMGRGFGPVMLFGCRPLQGGHYDHPGAVLLRQLVFFVLMASILA